MVSRIRRVFRIEPFNRREVVQAATKPDRQLPPDATDDRDQALCADEIIAEVHAVRAVLEGPALEAKKAIARLQGQIHEFERLKVELDLITGVISQAKEDAGSIYVGGSEGMSGQRVAKMVATLNFVDQHVTRMRAIWGDIEALAETAEMPTGQDVLLNVPKLDGEAGHVAPDDVEALWG